MISKRDISRLKAGTMPYWLSGQAFIIMREKVSMLFSDNIGWQWIIMDSPEKNAAVEIDRQTASLIIDNFNMQLAFQSGDGSIYELPGNPFLEAFDNKKESYHQKAS